MAEPGLRVRIARLASDDGAPQAPPAWMGAAEQQRWRASTLAGRRAFVASRRLLRDVLAEATGLSAEGWQVSAQAGSAPRASRPDGERATLPQLSIAHRLDWVAVAVGAPEGGPIGVDIECLRPARSDPADRAALTLPGDERVRWRALDDAEREAALLRGWVAREAWFKAAGAGAPWDFRRIASERCDAAQANVRIWEAGDLCVAVCACAALAGVTCEGWPPGAVARPSCWRVSACTFG